MALDKLRPINWLESRMAMPGFSGGNFEILTNIGSGKNGVDIWLVSAEAVMGAVNPLNTVSSDEVVKANSQKVHSDKIRILASRYLLRHALSWKTDNAVAPCDWKFGVGEFGKPFLENSHSNIDFNISYAGDIIAIAISSDSKVGVDIEKYPATNTPIEDALSESEQRYLKQFVPEQTNIEFTKFWTLKEASAKALGYGASLSFNKIDVTIDPLTVKVEVNAIPKLPTLSPTLQIVQHNGELLCLATVDTMQTIKGVFS